MSSALVKLSQRRLATTLLVLAAVLAVVPAGAETLYLEFSNHGLEDLGPGWAYEGWLIVAGVPLSTGTFVIGANGMPEPSRFAVSGDGVTTAAAFVLTIEPVPDADPTPSQVHVLAGEFVNSTAMLSAGHGAALGNDFLDASGPYILNAPSGGGSVPYSHGIWWLDPAGAPDPTLVLPTLPDGWVYEGWVVGAGGPVSTGRFADPTMVDHDGPGITGGPLAAPPLPGQDFVVPPTDLTSGYAAVLSIEPEPDNSPAPFVFKPLVDGIIDDVGAGVMQAMTNMADGFPTATVTRSEASAATTTAHLMLDFKGLEDLGPDAMYEGWLIVNGAPVSTGTFAVNGGVPSRSYFPTEVADLQSISAFVLTIEPVPDSDAAPSAVHVLAGDIVDGRAALAVDHPAAIGTDFHEISGSYILNAPSSGGSVPYTNGIWWLDPDAGPSATLELPELPSGWLYEGWVAGADGPISTGRFASADGMDSDGAGASGGSEEFPPFPGQDFVSPAIDLTSGYAAVISVEPEPDNSPAPFTLKPLMDPQIDDVGAGVLQPMHRNPAAMPTGMAVLAEPSTVVAAASTTGVGGARWYTDLDVANSGADPAMVLFQLLVSNQANPAPETVMFKLAGGQAMRYPDVLMDLFEYEGTGALRIVTDSTAVRTTSRTYAAGEDGSYGQGIPAFMAGQALTYGASGRLLQLSEGETFRTNIGFVNAGDRPATIHLELYAADGSTVLSHMLILDAAEHTQLNRVIPQSVEVAWARVWTSTPGAAFFAYASVVDNGVDDPTFIVAQ